MIENAKILAHLEQSGFYATCGRVTFAEFSEVCRRLGEVVLETIVKVRPEVNTYLCRPDAIPLHTDHPEIHLIGWYCKEQDDLDGDSILVDSQIALNQLPPRQQRLLSELKIGCPPLYSTQTTTQRRLFDPKSGSIYFAPWCLPAELTPEIADAVVAFVDRLEADGPHRFGIRLEPGELLVVDNQRMLHGRAEISAHSRRCLHRVWIRRRSDPTCVRAYPDT